MQSRNLFALLVLIGSTIAAPEPVPKLEPETAPEPFRHDDVILFNREGGYSVVKEAHFQSLIDKGEIEPAPPPTRTMNIQPQRRSHGGNDKRQDDCEKSNEVQVVSEKNFIGWDVPMSPVVAALAATATANVMQGYSISNYLTFAGHASGSIIIVSVTLDISYMRQWTSTQAITFLFQVPAGNYGIVVSEPWTRRIDGFLLTGCTDNPENISFQSDSYYSKSYGLLDWVDGAIRLCLSTVYPIPFCIGDGHHY